MAVSRNMLRFSLPAVLASCISVFTHFSCPPGGVATGGIATARVAIADVPTARMTCRSSGIYPIGTHIAEPLPPSKIAPRIPFFQRKPTFGFLCRLNSSSRRACSSVSCLSECSSSAAPFAAPPSVRCLAVRSCCASSCLPSAPLPSSLPSSSCVPRHPRRSTDCCYCCYATAAASSLCPWLPLSVFRFCASTSRSRPYLPSRLYDFILYLLPASSHLPLRSVQRFAPARPHRWTPAPPPRRRCSEAECASRLALAAATTVSSPPQSRRSSIFSGASPVALPTPTTVSSPSESRQSSVSFSGDSKYLKTIRPSSMEAARSSRANRKDYSSFWVESSGHVPLASAPEGEAGLFTAAARHRSRDRDGHLSGTLSRIPAPAPRTASSVCEVCLSCRCSPLLFSPKASSWFASSPFRSSSSFCAAVPVFSLCARFRARQQSLPATAKIGEQSALYVLSKSDMAFSEENSAAPQPGEFCPFREELTLTFVRVPARATQTFTRQLRKYLFRRPRFRTVQAEEDTGFPPAPAMSPSPSSRPSLPESFPSESPRDRALQSSSQIPSANPLCDEGNTDSDPAMPPDASSSFSSSSSSSPSSSAFHSSSSTSSSSFASSPSASPPARTRKPPIRQDAAPAAASTTCTGGRTVAAGAVDAGGGMPSAQENAAKGWRCIFLDQTVNEDLQGLPDEVRTWLLDQEAVSVGRRTVELSYANLTAEEILRKSLPADVEVPRRFEVVGHIAHLNLKAEQLPYKFLIARVLLDRVPALRTVVCKTGIASQWRELQFEHLAGERSYVARLKENDMLFEIDYAKVYWNSRLAAERERLLHAIPPGSIVLDLFAGVGAFSLFLAKRGCLVLANDGNPAAVACMKKNIALNKLQNCSITTFNLDARRFVRDAVGSPEQLVQLLRQCEDMQCSRRQAAAVVKSTSQKVGSADAGGEAEGARLNVGERAAEGLTVRTVDTAVVSSAAVGPAVATRGIPASALGVPAASTWGDTTQGSKSNSKRPRMRAERQGGKARTEAHEGENGTNREREAVCFSQQDVASLACPSEDAAVEAATNLTVGAAGCRRKPRKYGCPPAGDAWQKKATTSKEGDRVRNAGGRAAVLPKDQPAPEEELSCTEGASSAERVVHHRQGERLYARERKEAGAGDSSEEGNAKEHGVAKSVAGLLGERMCGAEIHYIMNLPELAVEFLDVFRGLLATPSAKSPEQGSPSDLLDAVREVKHRVHCYGFSRSVPPELDFKPRVEKALQHAWPEDTEVREVRDVAPNKRMYHIGFTVPFPVLTDSFEKAKVYKR